MLLSISTTHRPATDLGFLLHKNPANVRTVELPFGAAHVVYPEASDERCTAAVLVEVDPVGLTRRDGHGRLPGRFALQGYVNDRPYVASSFLSVALGKLFGTAMGGRCKDRPELVDVALPLEVHVPVLACRGGEAVLRQVLEPLGYQVETRRVPLDETHPDWGASRYLDVRLTVQARVADVLTQLYVLLPVFDDDKHYWVDDGEVDKLLRKGGDWLASHPARALIVDRYMKHQRSLTRTALAQLPAEDESVVDDDTDAVQDQEEAAVEKPLSLNTRRIGAVVAALKASGASRVVDLGCGEGRLLQALLDEPQFGEVAGVDVSTRALEIAERRLRLDRRPAAVRERVRLFQSSLAYRDRRLAGFDAAAVVEVVEHIDPFRLPAFERCLFGDAQPQTVVLTTPNVEHNVRFEGLPAGRLRHRDHRFEWTRAELRAWADRVAARHGYEVRYLPVGDDDPEVGPPTQMAVFTRCG